MTFCAKQVLNFPLAPTASCSEAGGLCRPALAWRNGGDRSVSRCTVRPASSRRPDCLQSDCEFHTRCAYTRIFRGVTVEAGATESNQGNTPPQPFALRDIPATDRCDHTYGFEISLFGRANLALRGLLIACAAMVEHGIPARNPALTGELARFGCLDHAAGQWRWNKDLTMLSIPPPSTPRTTEQTPASARIVMLTPLQLASIAQGKSPEPWALSMRLSPA